MQLSEYLNQNQLSVRGGYRHDSTLKTIINDPSLIGIRGKVLKTYSNVALYEEDNIGGILDLVFLTPSELYLVEVKTLDPSSKNKTTISEGYRQLRKSYRYFRKKFGISSTMRLVTKTGSNLQYQSVRRPIEHLLDSVRFKRNLKI